MAKVKVREIKSSEKLEELLDKLFEMVLESYTRLKNYDEAIKIVDKHILENKTWFKGYDDFKQELINDFIKDFTKLLGQDISPISKPYKFDNAERILLKILETDTSLNKKELEWIRCYVVMYVDQVLSIRMWPEFLQGLLSENLDTARKFISLVKNIDKEMKLKKWYLLEEINKKMCSVLDKTKEKINRKKRLFLSEIHKKIGGVILENEQEIEQIIRKEKSKNFKEIYINGMIRKYVNKVYYDLYLKYKEFFDKFDAGLVTKKFEYLGLIPQIIEKKDIQDFLGKCRKLLPPIISPAERKINELASAFAELG